MVHVRPGHDADRNRHRCAVPLAGVHLQRMASLYTTLMTLALLMGANAPSSSPSTAPSTAPSSAPSSAPTSAPAALYQLPNVLFAGTCRGTEFSFGADAPRTPGSAPASHIKSELATFL